MVRILLLLLLGLLPHLTAAPFNWEKAKELYPGIKLIHHAEEETRRLKADCMRIDLHTPGIRFYATGRAQDYGKPMPEAKDYIICTERITTADFLMNGRKRGINMLIAANAAPWSPWRIPWNFRYGQLSGLNIGEGEIVSDKKQGAMFVVWKDGRTEITDRVAREDYGKIEIAVSGFAILLRKGVIQPGSKDTQKRNPRMAYGLSGDKRYFYILTIDGRQPGWSRGASGEETAQLLRDAGASDGINMDGGGSTTLCYFDGKKVVMVNRHKGGAVRKVASNIGIAVDPEKPQKKKISFFEGLL